MRSAFLEPSDVRWGAFLSRVDHDVYHLPKYTALAAAEGGGEPVAYWAECEGAEVLVPLILRPVPGGRVGLRDCASPYGYASPLLSSCGNEGALDQLMDGFRDFLHERSVVTAFLRLHPLLNSDLRPLKKLGAVVEHGETVVIDLSQSPERLDGAIRKGYRYDARKLKSAGFAVHSDDWEQFPKFVEVYQRTMLRLGATPEYMYSRSHFEALREALGDHLHLFTVLDDKGVIAAASLVTTCGEIAQYHLSGTEEDFVPLGPTKLLLSEAIRWLRRLDLKWFHLGGGLGARSDSLFQFKAGFAKGRRTFSTLRMILDPGAYEELVAHAGGRLDSDLGEGFFPRYRG